MSESKEVTVPKGAKKPADRKPKAEKSAVVDGRRDVTVRGIALSIPENAFDDFETLDDIDAIEEASRLGDAMDEANAGDATLRFVRLLRRLLSPEDVRRVHKALRDPETGRYPIETGATFVGELLAAAIPNS